MTEKENIFLEKALLEQYAMDMCTPEEKQEVEAMLQESELIRKEYAEIQFYFEKLSFSKAKKAPAGLKATILEEIAGASEDTVIPIASEGNRRVKFWMVAASLAFLVALGAAFVQYQNNQDLLASQQRLETNLENATAEAAALNKQLEASKDELAFVKSTATEKVTLVHEGYGFKLATYWNEMEHKALLDLSNMTTPPKGKCFQLWADVDGEMMRVAIIQSPKRGLEEGVFFNDATSLNLTLEEAPGVDHATVENLLVGKPV